ncbi:MAG: hypothetical protein ABI873_15525 [Marmoricola sp.]
MAHRHRWPRLLAADRAITGLDRLTAIAGDVDDPAHRAEPVAAIRGHGPLDLPVHNAGHARAAR